MGWATGKRAASKPGHEADTQLGSPDGAECYVDDGNFHRRSVPGTEPTRMDARTATEQREPESRAVVCGDGLLAALVDCDDAKIAGAGDVDCGDAGHESNGG